MSRNRKKERKRKKKEMKKKGVGAGPLPSGAAPLLLNNCRETKMYNNRAEKQHRQGSYSDLELILSRRLLLGGRGRGLVLGGSRLLGGNTLLPFLRGSNILLAFLCGRGRRGRFRLRIRTRVLVGVGVPLLGSRGRGSGGILLLGTRFALLLLSSELVLDLLLGLSARLLPRNLLGSGLGFGSGRLRGLLLCNGEEKKQAVRKVSVPLLVVCLTCVKYRRKQRLGVRIISLGLGACLLRRHFLGCGLGSAAAGFAVSFCSVCNSENQD